MDMLREIETVRRLLANPSRWTKECEARDARGRPIDPCDDAAASFCIVGAFLHLASPEIDDFRAWLRLADAAADDVTGGLCPDVYAFNDDFGTEHAAVLRLLDRMAELAAKPPRPAGEAAWPLGQSPRRAAGWPM
jgi:hypothetical protein